MKILKIFFITISIITSLLVASYFIVVHNIKYILIHQITQEKKHQYDLSMTTFDLSLTENRLLVKDLILTVKDSNLTRNKFELKIKSIELSIHSLYKLLLKKELNVTRLVCEMPDIKIKPNKKSDAHKKLNLTKELGKLFDHIKQTIQDLNVEHFEITNGAIALLTTYQKVEPTHLTDLNLKINGFNLKNDNKELLSHEVHFYCHNQNFYTPDSNVHISFSKIDINNLNNQFEIDSLTIEGHKHTEDSMSYSYAMTNLKIINIDFNTLYNNNIFKCDSLLVNNPSIELKLYKNKEEEVKKQKSNAVSLLNKIDGYKTNENELKRMLGNIDIKYIGLDNSKIHFNTQTPKSNFTVKTENTTIDINTLYVSENPDEPIRIDDVYIGIKDYNRYSKDSMYHARFDAIRISKNTFELINYSLTPSKRNKSDNQIWLTSKRLAFNGVEYDELFYNSTVKAREIELYQPTIKINHNISIGESRTKKEPKINKASLLSLVNDKINIEDIKIKNGNLTILSPNNNTSEIKNLNTCITLEHLDRITNPEVYKEHLDYLTIDELNHNDLNNKLSIKKINYSKKTNDLSIETIAATNDQYNFKTKNTSILQLAYLNKKITAQRIATEGLDITLNKTSNKHHNNKKGAGFPDFEIDVLHIKNNTVKIKDSTLTCNVQIDTIHLDKLSKDSSDIHIEDFHINGKNFAFSDQQTVLTVQSFNLLKNTPSNLNNIQFSNIHKGDTLLVTLQNVNEKINWDQVLKSKKVNVTSIEFNEPKIYYSKNSVSTAHKNSTHSKDANFSIDEIKLNKACVDIKTTQHDNKNHISFPLVDASVKNLKISEEIEASKLDLLFEKWSVDLNQKTYVQCSSKASNISVSNVKHNRSHTDFVIDDLNINTNKISFVNQENEKTTSLKNLALSIKNQSIHLPVSNTLYSSILDNSTLEINHTNTSIETESGEYFLHQMGYGKHQFRIDSITYKPFESESKFMSKQKHQNDYVLLTTKKITVNNIDFDKFLNKNELTIQNIHIDGLFMYSFRDKRLPPKPMKYKALPTAMINKIKLPLLIKEITVSNSNIVYKETSDKSGLTGKINLADINARITNITNTNTIDSLRLEANTKLLGKGPLQLTFAQSYKDTLGGFSLKVNMTAFDMTQLNVVTEPLAGIKINSGYLHSLKIHALGNDLYSIGRIHMPYRSLNITLSKHSDTTAANPLGIVASLLANKFVVKTNNDKEGVIFFERLQHKSIFNFWFKLSMSGVMSSVGVKSSNKAMKHYEHYIKRNNILKPEEIELMN